MYTSKPVAEPQTYTKIYKEFKGVDLTSAVTEVDETRSPYAPNMIANMSGFPQKRTGLMQLASYDGEIFGIHPYIMQDGTGKRVIHAGTKLYEFGKEAAIYTGMRNHKSTSFVMNGKLYILDGEHYLSYDGTTVASVEASAYVPTTAIAMAPNGGGTDYEPINLLQPQRTNSYAGTEGDKVYQLDAQNIDSVVKCEKLAADGVTWTGITAFTYDKASGKVTFTTAPGKSPVTGDDNVKITFSKNVAGYADRIKQCTINVLYGIGNDHRIFVSGNPGYRNYDWYSWSGRADYFPDIGYSVVGSEIGAIMGYLKQYDDLVIIKKPNDQDASIFMRSASLDDKNQAKFITRQGLAGVGAASMYCFGTLNDDNLFLTPGGVFGLDTSYATQQKTTQLRSYYVNAQLTKEPGLEEAVACVLNGFYYLFVNGHVYVADSKQKNTNPSKSFGYEWYYWTDIPAACVRADGGILYVGSKDGKLYRLKTETEDGMQAYSDNGAPIYAAWATKMDDLSDASMYKTVLKQGTGTLPMRFAASSGDIWFVTDEKKAVKAFSMSTVFDFGMVDFNDINFGSLENPSFVPVRRKEKKVRMLQTIIDNNVVNQSFGIFQIQVAYQKQKYIKR